ncbi:MAG: DNA-binding protein [Clostridia bacterium]|nr:DNA-binding protein [Clostridia bacterium]
MYNQKTRILKYLETFGKITPKEARDSLGCERLAARIEELRKDGYDIRTEKTSGKNRYGENVQFATYKYHA